MWPGKPTVFTIRPSIEEVVTTHKCTSQAAVGPVIEVCAPRGKEAGEPCRAVGEVAAVLAQESKQLSPCRK